MSTPSERKNKAPEARTIVKEKSVPAKVVVGTVPAIDFRPPQGALKGALVVVVSDGTRTVSWTVHHPIGNTDLEDGDWVLSACADVPVLLEQRTDPDADRLNILRVQERVKMAVAAGFLEFNAAGVTEYKGLPGIQRDDVVSEARKTAKEQTKQAFHKWESSGSKGTKPADVDYMTLLSPEARAAEEKLVAFNKLETTIKEVERLHPATFRTRSGQRFDQDQVSACPLKQKPKGQDMFDGLVYQLSHMKMMGLATAKTYIQRLMDDAKANPIDTSGGSVKPTTTSTSPVTAVT